MSLKDRVFDKIKADGRQSPRWIPAPIRLGIRRISGGQRWTAQLIRGLFWRYRHFVLLALSANLAAAFFEGSTMAIFTVALETLAGEINTESTSSLGTLSTLTDSLRSRMGTSGLFFFLVGAAVVTQLLRSGLDFLSGVATSYLTAWSEGDLRRRMFRQMMGMSYGQISSYKTGDLVSYAEHVNHIGRIIIWTNQFIGSLFIVVAYSIILLWLSWTMTVAAVAALLLLSLGLRRITKKIHKISQHFGDAGVRFNERIVEYLRGMRLIHTFAREEYARTSVNSIISEAIRSQRQGLIWGYGVSPIVQSLTVIGVAAFLVIGYFGVLRSDTSLIPRLITFVFILYRLLPRITSINGTIASISQHLPYASRIAAILRTDNKEFVWSGQQPFDSLKEEITFQNVSFSYEVGKEKSGKVAPAVENLSFSLPRGSITALVGASGSGKSTIANLLLRLYDPTDGQLLVDQMDLKTFKIDDWRNRIGVVDQDTFIFHSTIAENIRFGRLDASQEEIEVAAKIANAHDFISELTHGYETVVGDRGYRLSGGQRQRITIARAIVRQPDVLILDEATSALDSQSERLIQKSLEELRRERTLVVIAHRLSTVMIADKILVLERGRIVETGTHDELLNQDTFYKHLWRIQLMSQ